MFPWNYGFHWTTATIIFMGAFYTVAAIIALTLVRALHNSLRVLRTERGEQIRWHADFQELPAGNRACRHELTGEVDRRACPNAFDCRACATHPAFLAKNPPAPQAGAEEDVFGMAFPLDRLYHRGHTWVRREQDGTVTVGLDDLGRRILGEPDAVTLPEPGSHVEVNGTGWTARKRSGAVRILCPVEGEVVETGGPGRDFYLRVKPGRMDLRHLLCPHEVRPWVMREMERLELALTAEGCAPALADGGVPVEDISTGYPEADWDDICGQMFLHP